METFWRQTERSYAIAIEAAVERQKQAILREQRLAYNIASLSGRAFAGKLKPFVEHFPPPDDEPAAGMTSEGAAVLSAMFTLKHRGIPIKIEKVSLH